MPLLSRMPASAPRIPSPHAVDQTAMLRGAKSQIPSGPTGLGTSAARLWASRSDGALGTDAADGSSSAGEANRAKRTATPGRASKGPKLYCPPAVRDDPALGNEVNDLLMRWAQETGIYAGELDVVRAADFGRLSMLVHPDTDDPDRLLAAAKCVLSEWATDDHYCEGEPDGDAPISLGSRISVAYAANDPAHLPLRYAPDLERVMRAEPVLVARRSSYEHLARYASSTQVARLQHEDAALFICYAQEASWRKANRLPPVWEYLVNRQRNNFVPLMALIDAVGGYELPSAEYSDPRVRRCTTMAGTAGQLVNDLYSMAKENSTPGLDLNLPTVIAAEDGCSRGVAFERSILIHDELMHTFEAEAATLAATGSPALRRFLAGVWAWLGGNREWHDGCPRYNSATASAPSTVS